jgi:hypothetical protein
MFTTTLHCVGAEVGIGVGSAVGTDVGECVTPSPPTINDPEEGAHELSAPPEMSYPSILQPTS